MSHKEGITFAIFDPPRALSAVEEIAPDPADHPPDAPAIQTTPAESTYSPMIQPTQSPGANLPQPTPIHDPNGQSGDPKGGGRTDDPPHDPDSPAHTNLADPGETPKTKPPEKTASNVDPSDSDTVNEHPEPKGSPAQDPKQAGQPMQTSPGLGGLILAALGGDPLDSV